MAQMKFRPEDALVDDVWGKNGTPEREAMEAKLKEEVDSYFVGEAIRKARMQKT